MTEQDAAAQSVDMRAMEARRAVEKLKRAAERGDVDAVVHCTIRLGRALAARDGAWPVHPIDAYKRGYHHLTGKQHP